MFLLTWLTWQRQGAQLQCSTCPKSGNATLLPPDSCSFCPPRATNSFKNRKSSNLGYSHRRCQPSFSSSSYTPTVPQWMTWQQQLPRRSLKASCIHNRSILLSHAASLYTMPKIFLFLWFFFPPNCLHDSLHESFSFDVHLRHFRSFRWDEAGMHLL